MNQGSHPSPLKQRFLATETTISWQSSSSSKRKLLTGKTLLECKSSTKIVLYCCYCSQNLVLSNRNNISNAPFYYWQEVLLLFVSMSQTALWRYEEQGEKTMLSENRLQFSNLMATTQKKTHAGATSFKVEVYFSMETAQLSIKTKVTTTHEHAACWLEQAFSAFIQQ